MKFKNENHYSSFYTALRSIRKHAMQMSMFRTCLPAANCLDLKHLELIQNQHLA